MVAPRSASGRDGHVEWCSLIDCKCEESSIENNKPPSIGAAMAAVSLKYTHAIVCRVPDSFATSLSSSSSSSGVTVDLDLAKQQHARYVQTLRDLGLDVIECAADENHPCSVFVEDTAVVVNGTALITRPHHPSRRPEVFLICRTVHCPN